MTCAARTAPRLDRAEVSSEHAERIMGHFISGVDVIYDRHKCAVEKANALRKLADLIAAIVHPRAATAMPLKQRRSIGSTK